MKLNRLSDVPLAPCVLGQSRRGTHVMYYFCKNRTPLRKIIIAIYRDLQRGLITFREAVELSKTIEEELQT